jgi:hypothetical protein
METGEVHLPAAVDPPASPILDSAAGQDTVSYPGDAPRPSKPARTWLRPGLVYAVGSLVLIALIVAAVNGTNRLQRTNDSITATRAELHRTATEVVKARAQLAVSTNQSDAAGRALAAAASQLTQVRAELASAQAGVRLDGVSISELDSCLSGVDQALNQISLGDQAGAAASLGQVAANCKAAEPSG